MNTYREHNELPDYQRAPYPYLTVPKWSGKTNPPEVGETVRVNMNNLGDAVVEGYFEEAGWLGLLVRLLDAPEWHRKQNDNDPRGHIFGAELKEDA